MDWKEMQVAPLKEQEIRQFAYEDESVVDSIKPISDWILVPGGVTIISLAFVPTDIDTYGSVETVIDTVNGVKTKLESELIVFEWTEGIVNFYIQTSLNPVTAFRVKYSEGTGQIKLFSRAQ